jgi:hypothetical protein
MMDGSREGWMFFSDNKGTLLRGRQQHDETITTDTNNKKKKKKFRSFRDGSAEFIQ